MSQGFRRVRRQLLLVRHAAVHVQPGQEAALDLVLPAMTRHPFDQVPGDDVEQVVIGELGAETGLGLQVGQGLIDLGAVGLALGQHHQIAGIGRQARAVADQIANGELTRHPGIRQAELRHIVDDRIVPVQPPFLLQLGDHCGGEGLRDRTDAEQGVGVDRHRRPVVHDAVALQVGRLSRLDHRDSDAWNFKGRERRFHDLINLSLAEPNRISGDRFSSDRQGHKSNQRTVIAKP
ncbi:hypothetical protein D3C72_1335690 [compost metagenome]